MKPNSNDGLCQDKNDRWYVYILECSNGSYYTGYARDIEKRYRQHLDGTGAKFTRSFKPTGIAQCWEVCADKSTAMKVESWLKTQNRERKMEIIKDPGQLQAVVIEKINPLCSIHRYSFIVEE